MSKDKPDHHDAEIVMKLYDLRREAVIRAARDGMVKFMPTSYDEFIAITKPEHPLNAAYRQTSSYWEMVYGMAKHGVVHTEFLLESNGEGLLLYARLEPYIAAIRTATSPRAFTKAEWIANSCDLGKAVMETFRGRVKKMTGGK